MQLNWKDLEVFVRVCDSGSLTRGAERSHISIPAVSARIQRLEAAAGGSLLTRHSRGVAPTDLGTLVLTRARNASNEIAELHATLQDMRRQRTPFRLLCNTSALLHHVPRFMGELLRRSSCGPIEVTESSSRQSISQLKQGHAHVGIVSDAVAVNGLDVEPLCEDHLIVAVADNHPLRGEAASFADALEFPQVCFGAKSALTVHLVEQADAIGRTLRPTVFVNDLETVCSLVEDGYGIAVLSRAMLRSVKKRRNLRQIELTDRWAKRKLLACSARPLARNPDLRQIYDAVVRSFSTFDKSSGASSVMSQ